MAWSLLGMPPLARGFLLRECDNNSCIAPEHHRPAHVGDLPHNSPAQRAAAFWRRVDSTSGPDECWPWEVVGVRYGRPAYGMTSIHGVHMGTHRAAWILTRGPVPEGMLVCHSCDHPPCCNPAHLFLGTYADNSADMVRKGRAARLAGCDAPNARLTEDQVRDARALYAAGGISFRALGERYGVTPMAAQRMVRGHTYGCVPGAVPPTQPFRSRKTRRAQSIDTWPSAAPIVSDMAEDLLTSAEVCERLGIDRSTLSRRVASGRIVPAHKLPGLRGAFLFAPAEVEKAKAGEAA